MAKDLKQLARKYKRSPGELTSAFKAILKDPTANPIQPKTDPPARKLMAKSKDIGGGKIRGFRVIYLWDEATAVVTILHCYAKPDKKKQVSAEINKLSSEYEAGREAREAAPATDDALTEPE